MVWLIRIFFVFLADFIVNLGWKLIKGLGFGLVGYTGISFFLDRAMGYVFNHLFTLPPEWLGFVLLLKLDVCIKIYFAAYAARAMLWGVNSAGSKSKLTFKGGH